MNDAQAPDPRQELEDLQRLLQKREGKPGFAANVAEIRAQIAELESQQSAE